MTGLPLSLDGILEDFPATETAPGGAVCRFRLAYLPDDIDSEAAEASLPCVAQTPDLIDAIVRGCYCPGAIVHADGILRLPDHPGAALELVLTALIPQSPPPALSSACTAAVVQSVDLVGDAAVVRTTDPDGSGTWWHLIRWDGHLIGAANSPTALQDLIDVTRDDTGGWS